mmetsp:Transcript_8599/g.21319  ORF Transcript_8599/g.21319 Transcript_8599/m.21319 type:complete len:93 (-) Transcript_8599:80-358(-)
MRRGYSMSWMRYRIMLAAEAWHPSRSTVQALRMESTNDGGGEDEQEKKQAARDRTDRGRHKSPATPKKKNALSFLEQHTGRSERVPIFSSRA